MKATGPKEERETVIVFNEGDKIATIWTASQIIYKAMRKRGWTLERDDERTAVFVVPKGQIRLPRQKKKFIGERKFGFVKKLA